MKEKFFFILVILVLITVPALAGKVNVATADVAAEFGAVIAESTIPSTSSGGGWTLSIDVEVRKKFDSVLQLDIYSYLFVVNATDSGIGISSLTIDSSFFDSTLNTGTVGGDTVGNVSFGGNLTFQFSSPTLTTTIYAQSTVAPGDVLFWGYSVIKGSSGEGTTLGPVATPEPGTLLLLGSGLLGTGLFAKKKLL